MTQLAEDTCDAVSGHAGGRVWIVKRIDDDRRAVQAAVGPAAIAGRSRLVTGEVVVAGQPAL